MIGFIEVKFEYRKEIRRKLIRISDIIYVRERLAGAALIGLRYTEPSTFKVFDLSKPSELCSETPYEEVLKQIEENSEEVWDDCTVGF